MWAKYDLPFFSFLFFLFFFFRFLKTSFGHSVLSTSMKYMDDMLFLDFHFGMFASEPMASIDTAV